MSIVRSHDLRQLVQRLTEQAPLVAQGETGNLVGLAEHLRTRFLPAVPAKSHENQLVIDAGVAAEGTAQATEQAGVGQPQLFQSLHGILQMTVPDKPTSPAQRYVFTDAGVQLKKLLHEQQADVQPGGEDNGH